MELASGRHLTEVRRQALDRDEPLLGRFVDARHRAQQRPRVGMLGILEDRARGPLLDHPARVHHDHSVAEACHQRHVVGDQDHRRAKLAAEVTQQLDDRGLDSHIKGSGGLVGNQQRRLVGDPHRDHGALAHAARELMRVVPHAVLRRRYAHALQHGDDTLLGLVTREPGVGGHRLLNLKSDAEHRVERGHRVLEDHRDLVATELPDLLVRHLDDVLLAVEDPSACDLAGLGDQPEDGERRHRLARARLAHDADDLAAVDLEVDSVHRSHRAAGRGELNPKVLHPE